MKFAWINEGAGDGPVTGLNREVQDGEMQGNVSPQQLIYGMDHRDYEVFNFELRTKSVADRKAQQFKWKVESIMADNKAECSATILGLYSLEVQSSMSLGIYPAEEVQKMREWIAAMIQEENRVYDLLLLAQSEVDLASIETVWPDVEDFPVVEEEVIV